MFPRSWYVPVSAPGQVWPIQPTPEVSPLWAAYRELDRTQWLAPAALLDGQLAQVRVLLRHALDHVPYYRETLTQAGVVPETIHTLDDFRRVPILTRHTYQQRTEEFQAGRLPAGTQARGQSTTSGTSGVPIRVTHTSATQLWWTACFLRDLEWAGFDPRGRLAGIRSYGYRHPDRAALMEGVEAPLWHGHLHGLLATGPAFAMDIHQDPRRQLDWLFRVRPDYLFSMPANLDCLGSLLRERGDRLPGLCGIQSFDNSLSDEVYQRLRQAFGVPIKNLYSCSEAGYLASTCPDGYGLHVHAENVLLEVLDHAGAPCGPGQTGRVVLTTLHNFLAPFVRYEILDDATVGPGPCPCGRGLPLLTAVHGKRQPLLHLPNGRVKVAVFLLKGLWATPGIRQYQVVQRAVDHVLIRIAASPDWPAERTEHVRHLVEEFFEGPMRTEVEIREYLELPPGGKLLDVVSEIADPSRGSGILPDNPSRGSGIVPDNPSRGSGILPDNPPRQAGSLTHEGPLAATGGKTILLGWELGAGLGHVQPLLALARGLAAHGHRPVFALRDVVTAWPLLRDANFPVYQAPLLPSRPRPADAPPFAASYADILALHGYGTVEELAPLVQAWQSLLDATRPALVVADHAPTLCLAAYGTVPTALLGTGFTVPPADAAVFPPLVPNQQPLLPEDHLLAVVREVQSRRGRPAPATLPSLLAGAARLLRILPEMDPYRPGRREPYLGPLERLAEPSPLPDAPRFFAYLSADYGALEEVLAALATAGIPGGVYARKASAAVRDRLRQRGLEVFDAPRPLAEVIPTASVLVHHGGANTTQLALSAGRPQLLFPEHLEQALTARSMHQLGVAHYLWNKFPAADVPTALRQLTTETRFRDRAQAVARDIRGRNLGDPLPGMVGCCLELLTGKKS